MVVGLMKAERFGLSEVVGLGLVLEDCGWKKEDSARRVSSIYFSLCLSTHHPQSHSPIVYHTINPTGSSSSAPYSRLRPCQPTMIRSDPLYTGHP